MPENSTTADIAPALQPPFPLNLSPAAQYIADTIIAAGGKPVLVGGAVRDRLLGLPVKDIDIEVFGLPWAALLAALQAVARVHMVGKSFGILKVYFGGEEIDVSLPRRERKAGVGHRGFDVQSDPTMEYQEAASRRDFTINAIGVDLLQQQLLDPWHGIDDLRAGVLRHVTDAFDEDPLRVLRACQFAARFGFAIAPETVTKCRHLQGELPSLSVERIWEELKKLLLKAPCPSVGIKAIAETGADVLFPELAQTAPDAREVPGRVLDRVAADSLSQQWPEDARLTLLFAALARYIQPLTPTRIITLLQHCGCPLALHKSVPPLALHVTTVFQLAAQKANDAALRRFALAVPIRPVCLLASALAAADPSYDRQAPLWLLTQAERCGVAEQAPQALLQGRHLLAHGLKPGVAFKSILDTAFEAQLDGEFADTEQAQQWLRQYLARHS